MAQDRQQYEAQIAAIAQRVRQGAEDRLAAGWQPNIAFDDAIHRAADSDRSTEATVQMMTLACALLARGWRHSEAFVAYWNGLFPHAPKVEGFANAAMTEVDGQPAAIIATWSDFMSAGQKRDG